MLVQRSAVLCSAVRSSQLQGVSPYRFPVITPAYRVMLLPDVSQQICTGCASGRGGGVTAKKDRREHILFPASIKTVFIGVVKEQGRQFIQDTRCVHRCRM